MDRAATGHISVRDVVIRYQSSRSGEVLQATAPLRLEIAAGEWMMLVGPSGCGKTSLLNAIAGLIAPAEGEVAIDGVPVRGPGIDRAVVFQDYGLFPWRTVWDNVAFGLRLAARRGRVQGIEAKVRAALELVGLSGFAKAYPHELSGGMKQRVGIARALVVEPAILLMDEPFAAVDAMTREMMQAELLRILQATRATVVFVTHSIDEAILLGDRIALLSARPGRIKEVVTVPFGRRRDPARVRLSAEYAHLRERIWQSLYDIPGERSEPRAEAGGA